MRREKSSLFGVLLGALPFLLGVGFADTEPVVSPQVIESFEQKKTSKELDQISFDASSLVLSASKGSLDGAPHSAGNLPINPSNPEENSNSVEKAEIISREEALRLLQREVGQTEFITLPQFHYRGPEIYRDESAGSSQMRKTAEPRIEQEADIFKIGKKGSNTLYLLNNYRGLQIVSFQQGPDQPQLVGRVPATGNIAREMYFDIANDQLFVFETLNYSRNKGWTTPNSRIVVYDVADPHRPFISRVTKVRGDYVESRIVGNILYVVSNVAYQSSEKRYLQKSIISSYAIEHQNLQFIEAMKLTPSGSRQNTLNIVRVEADDSRKQDKYYLIVVLTHLNSEKRRQGNVVEVIDISSTEGKIVPVLSAITRGQINEKSQTSIKNNTLITVSNYRQENSGTLKIIVEAFPFSDSVTTDGMRVINNYSNKSVQNYRRSKSTVVIEAPMDLGANLQDVRFHNDLLYIFWVPFNNIDPLDIIDISQPERGLKLIGHLEFDGWIQRSFPIFYRGREFILGVGFVDQEGENGARRRVPQVALFQIVKNQDSGVKARIIERVTVTADRAWGNFNGSDRNVEFRIDEDGLGSLMFIINQYHQGKYSQGGKLIDFNLNRKRGDIFQDRGILDGRTGWLRRVFYHEDIRRINAFSDLELGTFNVEEDNAEIDFVKATHILELARNIQSYISLHTEEKSYGVQIITDLEAQGRVELRLVDAVRADSEKGDIHHSSSLEGRLLDYRKIGKSKFIVLSAVGDHGKTLNHMSTVNKETLRLSQFTVNAKKLVKIFEDSWSESVGFSWYGGGQILEKVSENKILINIEQPRLLKLGNDGIGTESVNVEVECPVKNGSIKVFSNKAYFTWSAPVLDEEGKKYHRNFISKLRLKGNRLSCKKSVNIPGTPFNVRKSHLVTLDSIHQKIVSPVILSEEAELGRIAIWPGPVEKNLMLSLSLKKQRAVLVDKYKLGNNTSPSAIKVLPDGGMYFFKAEVVPHNGFGDSIGLGHKNTLMKLTFHDDRFQEKKFDIVRGLSQARVLDVSKVGRERYQIVIANGQNIQAFFNEDESILPIQLRLPGESKWKSAINYPGFTNDFNFNRRHDTVEISSGYYGILQLILNSRR